MTETALDHDTQTLFPETCRYCGHTRFDIEAQTTRSAIRQIVACAACGRTLTDQRSQVEGPRPTTGTHTNIDQ